MRDALRIGTRGSALALWQARTVATLLAARGTRAELVIIKTSGDRLQDRPLSEDGGKRLFVKEIEEALLSDRIDIAVHSAKDMPAEDPGALLVAAVLPREDPRDAIVLPGARPETTLTSVLTAMAPSAAIGTGSVRRIAQIRALIPGARFDPIRGNVDSRLRKLDAGEFDALVLAAAGLKRLGLHSRLSAAFPIEACVPAPGQGIVAIQIRASDTETAAALVPLNDADAFAALTAERAVVAALGGGCQLPLGAFATIDGESLQLRTMVATPDGSERIVRSGRGTAARPAELGLRLARELIEAGAGRILDAVRDLGA